MAYRTNFELTSQELRDIIFGKTTFKKCPACDNNGKAYYDENGCPPLPYPHPDWGDNYVTEACEECDGLGYLFVYNI